MTVLRPTLVLVATLTVITGLAYPLAVTGAAAVLFPEEAGGSLVLRDGVPVGSALVGQPFDDPAWFWGRPSATAPLPYDGLGSAGSNLGPTHPALAQAVRARIAALREADPGAVGPVPVDLVTASASGLDPDVSPAAAFFQVDRVARARGLDPSAVRTLVLDHVEPPLLGIVGAPHVNVLGLNLALEAPR